MTIASPSSRDRITVDLGPLKAPLFAQAAARGLTPSAVIREVLAAALGHGVEPETARGTDSKLATGRLTLRMELDSIAQIRIRAGSAGLSIGRYLSDLSAGVPAVADGHRPADLAKALSISCAELATLGRDLRHLTQLLKVGDVAAAQPYRERLEQAGHEVRTHLNLASRVLASLQGRGTRPKLDGGRP